MSNLKATYEFRDLITVFVPGDPIVFTLCITPEEDQHVEKLKCQLTKEVRGRLRRVTDTIDSCELEINDMLKKGTTYEYPVELKNSFAITYAGISVSQSLYLDVASSEQGKTLISKVKQVFVHLEPLARRVVIVEHASVNYNVVEKSYDLKNDFLMKLFFGMFFTIPLLIFGCQFLPASFLPASFPKTLIPYLIGVGVFILLIPVLLHFWFETRVGKSSVQLSNTDNNEFEVKVNNSNDWVSSPEIFLSYSIIEEVVDDRGTSSTTIKMPIYQSLSVTIKTPRNGSKVVFPFPEKSIPLTNRIPNTEIVSILNLKMVTPFGTRKYSTPFKIQDS